MVTKIRQLLKTEGFKRNFLNTGWQLAEKVIRMGAALFVGVWVARYLGPEQFGVLSYSISLVGLFAVLGVLGLDSIVVRDMVKEPNAQGEILGTAVMLKLFGALFVVLCSVIVSVSLGDSHTTIILVSIIATASIFKAAEAINLYYQAMTLGKYIALANTVAVIGGSALKVVFILIEAPLYWFAVALAVDGLFLAISLVLMLSFTEGAVWWRKITVRITRAKSLLSEAWPLLFSGMVIAVYMKIDQVMLQQMAGSDSVGQYAAAVRLSEALYFIPVVIASSLFPSIINAKSQSKKIYNHRMRVLYRFMILGSLILIVPLYYLSLALIETLYGKDFHQSAGVLKIHIWSAAFVFIGVASSKWMILEGLQKYLLTYTACGALLNITLNALLIPKLGIQGAAWATLLSQCLASYLALVLSPRTRPNFIAISQSVWPFNRVDEAEGFST